MWLAALLFAAARLWQDVTAKLKLHNVEEATEHKHRIEQQQRDDAKRRLENGETWDTRVTILVATFRICIGIVLGCHLKLFDLDIFTC